MNDTHQGKKTSIKAKHERKDRTKRNKNFLLPPLNSYFHL